MTPKKGRPTPPAPQNRQAPAGPPPSVFVIWPTQFEGQLSEHQQIEGTIFDAKFSVGGLAAIVRMPLDAAEDFAKGMLGLIGQAREAPAEPEQRPSGLHLPGNVNIDQEAAAHDRLRGGQQ